MMKYPTSSRGNTDITEGPFKAYVQVQLKLKKNM